MTYRIHANFFKNGEQKAYYEAKETKKPVDRRDIKHGVTGFFVWTNNELSAKRLTYQINNKKINRKEMNNIFKLFSYFSLGLGE